MSRYQTMLTHNSLFALSLSKGMHHLSSARSWFDRLTTNGKSFVNRIFD